MEINYKKKIEIGDTITDTHNGMTVTGVLVKVTIEYDGKITKVFHHLDTGVIIEVGYVSEDYVDGGYSE